MTRQLQRSNENMKMESEEKARTQEEVAAVMIKRQQVRWRQRKTS